MNRSNRHTGKGGKQCSKRLRSHQSWQKVTVQSVNHGGGESEPVHMIGSANEVKDIPVQGMGLETYRNGKKRSNAKRMARKGSNDGIFSSMKKA